MGPIVLSREEILRVSRELIRKKGWEAVNIRGVAAACGVSVGSIYNYFDSKTALVTATVESVWWEIFHKPINPEAFSNIEAFMVGIYQQMAVGAKKYPGFFTLHALGFIGQEKADGRRKMKETWQHIEDGICNILRSDPNIVPGAFHDEFTVEAFAEVLFSLMISALLREDFNPASVVHIIRCTVYGAASPKERSEKEL